MTPEKLDRDSLSQLYALAKKAQELAYNSQNPQAVEDFHDAISPDVVTALIDRVRELERALSNAVYLEPKLLRIANISNARAALERSEILNKE